MRRIATAVLVLALLLVPLAISAQSGGDFEEKLRIVEDLMRRLQEAGGAEEPPEITFERGGRNVLQVHNVADLTVRLTDFVRPNLTLRPAGAEIDENMPLFGCAVEGELFFTGAEELADLIRNNVRPDLWESGLSSIRLSGPYGLIVVAEPAVQEEVARYLSELRSGVGRVVTVEIRVIEINAVTDSLLPSGASAVALSREEGLALIRRAEEEKGLRLFHSARITGFSGQRISLHDGAQMAFLQDYDVEVAQESTISDPIVNVLQTGFAFDVRPTVRGEDLVVLDLRAQLSALNEPLRIVETASGPAQAPAQGLMNLATTITVPVGGFTLVGAGGGRGARTWALLLSTGVERIESGKGGGK